MGEGRLAVAQEIVPNSCSISSVLYQIYTIQHKRMIQYPIVLCCLFCWSQWCDVQQTKILTNFVSSLPEKSCLLSKNHIDFRLSFNMTKQDSSLGEINRFSVNYFKINISGGTESLFTVKSKHHVRHSRMLKHNETILNVQSFLIFWGQHILWKLHFWILVKNMALCVILTSCTNLSRQTL